MHVAGRYVAKIEIYRSIVASIYPRRYGPAWQRKFSDAWDQRSPLRATVPRPACPRPSAPGIWRHPARVRSWRQVAHSFRLDFSTTQKRARRQNTAGFHQNPVGHAGLILAGSSALQVQRELYEQNSEAN